MFSCPSFRLNKWDCAYLEQISGVVDAKNCRLEDGSCAALLPPASASPLASPLSVPDVARKSHAGLIDSTYLALLHTTDSQFLHSDTWCVHSKEAVNR